MNQMVGEFKIEYDENPETSAWGIIGRGVGTFNDQQVGDQRFQRLCYVLRDSAQEIVGGAIGELYYDWFHLDLLWVKDDLRGRGYGYGLLLKIEDEARQRGAKNIFLDTFSFQAPDFYKKYGYQVFGELNDFPAGHTRLYLTKHL